MKFQVPQFVEVEDKLFWSLTLKQFIYLAGGGGITVILFLFLPKFAAVIVGIPIIAFSLALAFYKYNNRPFIVVVEAATKYLFNDRLYIWRKVDPPADVKQGKDGSELGTAFVPKLSDSKLKDLTWSLDTKEAPNPLTKEEK